MATHDSGCSAAQLRLPRQTARSVARTSGSTYGHHCSHYAGRPLPAVPRPSRGRFLGNFWTKGNRPSFGLTHGDDPEPPGLAILAGYYEKGYAERYSSIFEAEQQHGTLIISRLGTLSKFKPDGSLKHRITQDLRRGGANILAGMLERIVLPRPIDHGWDLYSLRKK